MISCPADIEERSREGENVAYVSWPSPSVADNSGISIEPQLTAGQEPGNDFVIGEYLITYVAVDEAENENSCSFTVYVKGRFNQSINQSINQYVEIQAYI